MSDRELLELAAKAAGLPHKWLSVLGGMYHVIDAGRMDGPWSPLEDDGDAFRLAVKLRMDVETSLVHCGNICADVWDDSKEDYTSILEPEGSDPCAATRRAVVRAAAALASPQALGSSK